MRMAKVAVSGSIAYDRIMDFPGYFRDHIMPDKLHALSVSFTIEKLTESFGGTAGNVAYNLSLLGVEAELYATAGSDFDTYRNRLSTLGVGMSKMNIVAELPTASAYIMTDKADNQISGFYPGAAVSQCMTPVEEGAKVAIIGASSASDMLQRAKLCREAKVPYLFDPGQQTTELSKEDIREIVSGSVAIFGNDYEMEMIMQKTGWTIVDIVQHVPIVVTTLGISGSKIMTAEKEYSIESVRVADPVDPTGAGDAYRAGFIKGYLSDFPTTKAARLASATASFCVEKRGTQNHRFTMAELAERYEHTYGEALGL